MLLEVRDWKTKKWVLELKICLHFELDIQTEVQMNDSNTEKHQEMDVSNNSHF